MADIAKLLMLTVNTMSLTDNDALSVKSVYPEWETLIGKEVKQGDKMQCDGRLVESHPAAHRTGTMATGNRY